MNLCTLAASNGSVAFGGVEVSVPGGAPNGTYVLGLRPESLDVASEGLPARVEVVEDVGADAYVFCSAELGGESTRLIARAEARRAPQQGDRVSLRPRAEEAHLFDPVSGTRLERR